MLAALRKVPDGQRFLPAEALRGASANAGVIGTVAGNQRLAGLTPRQVEADRAAVGGLPNKLIGREIGIAESAIVPLLWWLPAARCAPGWAVCGCRTCPGWTRRPGKRRASSVPVSRPRSVSRAGGSITPPCRWCAAIRWPICGAPCLRVQSQSRQYRQAHPPQRVGHALAHDDSGINPDVA